MVEVNSTRGNSSTPRSNATHERARRARFREASARRRCVIPARTSFLAADLSPYARVVPRKSIFSPSLTLLSPDIGFFVLHRGGEAAADGGRRRGRGWGAGARRGAEQWLHVHAAVLHRRRSGPQDHAGTSPYRFPIRAGRRSTARPEILPQTTSLPRFSLSRLLPSLIWP